MPSVVVDTHAAIWYLLDDERLSQAAGSLLDEAAQNGYPILLSAISLVEVVYLVEKGRLPSSTRALLEAEIDAPRGSYALAPLDRNVVNALPAVERSLVPDLPDRVIAATALAWNLPLVSRDAKIRTSQVRTIC